MILCYCVEVMFFVGESQIFRNSEGSKRNAFMGGVFKQFQILGDLASRGDLKNLGGRQPSETLCH